LLFAHGGESKISKSPKLELGMAVAGLVAVLLPAFLLSDGTPFPGPAALPSVAGAVLLIASRGSWVNRRILAFPALVFVGRVSYSWYLWHWPALAYLRVILGHPLSESEGLLAISTAFGIAVLSYYFIEQPARQTSMAPVRLLPRYAIICLCLAAAGGAIWYSRGIPSRFPALAIAEKEAMGDILSDPCIIRSTTSSANMTERCYERLGHTKFVALWGDSHGAAVGPALRDIAHRNGYGFRELNMARCPPLPDAVFFSSNYPAETPACKKFNRQIAEVLANDPQVTTVILAGAWSGYVDSGRDAWLSIGDKPSAARPSVDEMLNIFSDALARNIERLQAAGKQVIVFEDSPIFNPEPLWRMRSSQIPLRRILLSSITGAREVDSGSAHPDDAEIDARITGAIRKIAKAHRAESFDLKQSLCDALTANCLYRIDQQSLYMDGSHLSTRGAELALSRFSFIEESSKTGEVRARSGTVNVSHAMLWPSDRVN
jgi:hypothetical protein